MKIRDRYQTGLLWKNDVVELPESYNMALKRLINIEKRIARDQEFAKAYRDNIDSYVKKNYARKLQPHEVIKSNPRTWYLPHFAVANPHKPDKFRLVFDAAATSHGVSLNSQLLKGPQEYRPLLPILFHFRQNAVAVCADIQEMFHQVVIRLRSHNDIAASEGYPQRCWLPVAKVQIERSGSRYCFGRRDVYVAI